MRRKTANAYRQFHGKSAATVRRVQMADLPREMWVLGDVVSIVYKRPDGDEPVPYEHKFRRPRPKLATDPKGRRLYLVGGGYRVTSRGIVR